MINRYYDGIEAFKHLCQVQETDDAILKFCRYRRYNYESPNVGDQIDIDVSEWAIDTYSAKYPFLKSAIKENQVRCIRDEEVKFAYKFQLNNGEDDVYIGDTMVSFGSIIKHYINIDALFGANVNGIKRLVDMCLDDPDTIKKCTDERIKRLASMIRTEGNLIPVPMFFNVERSGVFANCDHWDLVMQAFYSWYKDNKNDKYIILLLNRYDNNQNIDLSLKYCKQWLRNFGSWKDFVDCNYLQPYVDGDYKPVELWKDHFEGRLLADLKDREEFMTAVDMMADIIEKRNELLYCL